jgi:hypothetical protein
LWYAATVTDRRTFAQSRPTWFSVVAWLTAVVIMASCVGGVAPLDIADAATRMSIRVLWHIDDQESLPLRQQCYSSVLL